MSNANQDAVALPNGGGVSVAGLKRRIPSQTPYQVCVALFWGGVAIAAALRTRLGLGPSVIVLYVAGMGGGLAFWLLLIRKLGYGTTAAVAGRPWCWPFFLWLAFAPPRRPASWWRWLAWGATIPTFVLMMWAALRTGNAGGGPAN